VGRSGLGRLADPCVCRRGAGCLAEFDPGRADPTWDEAIPLGNGLLGGLLWGEANVLRLSLDRGDLWDLRTPDTIREAGFTYANLQQLVRDKNQAEISRLFDAPYNHPTPTKIPGGRLEIVLDPAQQTERFELNLATAEGRTMLSDGRRCITI
jgi:alpha-L-fucosidase 2